MKCTHCGHAPMQLLGVWYVLMGDVYVLATTYGCIRCRILSTRILGENDHYYQREDGSIVTLDPHMTPAPMERRLRIVNYDPAFGVKKDG